MLYKGPSHDKPEQKGMHPDRKSIRNIVRKHDPLKAHYRKIQHKTLVLHGLGLCASEHSSTAEPSLASHEDLNPKTPQPKTLNPKTPQPKTLDPQPKTLKP